MVLIKLTVLMIITLAEVHGLEVVGWPLNTLAVKGNTAKLSCFNKLKSCFQIQWQKRWASGQVANISYGNTVYDVRKYRLDNSSVCDLVIQNVQLSDSGTFICTIAGSTYGFADLIVLEAEPSCSTSCEKDSTAEKDNVDYKCKLTYSGGGKPEMTWLNKRTRFEVAGVRSGSVDGSTVSRDFAAQAVTPEVNPLICVTRFYFNQTLGRVSNVPEVPCETESCSILYSVRNVITWPLLYASPGEEVTCKADGNPEPSFEWQWKEKDGDDEWMDVPDEKSEKIETFLNNGTSYKLRCIAKNSVNDVPHSDDSPAVTVSKHGAAKRTGIIVGVIVGVVLLVIIAGVVYKFCFSE